VIASRGRARLTAIAVVVTLAVAALAGVLVLAGSSGCGLPADRACLRVLFIGNSYTSTNDLPGVLAGLLRSGGRHAEVSAIAPGGATLADHAASAEVAGAIAGSPWTAVILQEQSLLPAAPDLLERQILPAARTLADAARGTGAQVYLFQTWAHRDGWPERRLDRAAMQAAITATDRELAGRLGLVVVPVGEAWTRALREAPGISLWQADGSHPTAAGTYLAACVLYASLTGRSPAGLGETGGLPAADAATLQRIAAEP
jgi:hypothetical protein